MTASTDLPSGLLVLHGNRLELLREAVFEYVERHPPGPLEEEVFLVQSNGIAEWLKMALARQRGVCAATRVELPARFLWRTYRAMLGAAGAPMQSPLDEAPLVWRLMRVLASEVIHRPGFEPLAGFLAPGGAERRLQLAQRLADLYDQYQVYRADWLEAWAHQRDVLDRMPNPWMATGRSDPQGPVASSQATGSLGASVPVPEDQLWQPRLWRLLLDELDQPGPDDAPPPGRHALRPAVHRRFVQALQEGRAPVRPLPRRVVLFGHSHLPLQTLEALEALSRRVQVILAVPNPCQYHWADIIDGRELLTASRRRQRRRSGTDGGPATSDLADLPLELAHARAHPLLAAWGRQGRDFVRLLDAFDDAQAAQARFAMPRIDLFDATVGEAPDGETPAPLLEQLQGAVRDLRPLDEHPRRMGLSLEDSVAADDRSIVFHVAHGAQREVEVLHDQLLRAFAQAQAEGRALSPRDVVVMVPDIEPYAPLIRAVFGQIPRGDARHIPYEITDVRQRRQQPLLMALEWLLRTPQRATASELRDLLEVPALARCFGIDVADRPLIVRWLDGAGVRWGLHAGHRADLGLPSCGEANTWAFGLRRMLLGYAAGRSGVFDGIEPYDEVGGLEAALAGALAELLHRLDRWWTEAAQDVTPTDWATRARGLLEQFFDPAEERERLLLAGLTDALDRWLDHCDGASFVEPVPLAVLREGWLGALEESGLNQRFLGGGVTFCTLMPMRAIPFEIVCLLGMNDGDYPRRAPRADFDLMGQPQVRRPGDRARRDDDRYLMLEAVLSARRRLYLSWAGRSPRDQSVQPPSVLVAQLRDYLAAGWGEALPARLTTEHPLQAFSRRYFEPGAAEQGLFTYAREWREAHVQPSSESTGAVAEAPAERELELTLASLADMLRRPVRFHFRHRLRIDFDDSDTSSLLDDEPFGLDGLEHWRLLDEVMDELDPDLRSGGEPGIAEAGSLQPGVAADDAGGLDARLERVTRRIAGQGRLPLADLGERVRLDLQHTVEPMAQVWRQLQQEWRSAGGLGDEVGTPAAVAVEAAAEPSSGRIRLQGQWTIPDGDGSMVTVRLDDWIEDVKRHADGTWAVLRRSSSRLADRRENRRTGDITYIARPKSLLEDALTTLAASAQGVVLQAVRMGRDVVTTTRAVTREQAAPILSSLVAAWVAARRHPLPLAADTALAWLSDEDELSRERSARERYEGGGFSRGEPEVRTDAALARIYPDFDALVEGLPDTPAPESVGCVWDGRGEMGADAGEGAGVGEGLGGEGGRGFETWVPMYGFLVEQARERTRCIPLSDRLGRTETGEEGA